MTPEQKVLCRSNYDRKKGSDRDSNSSTEEKEQLLQSVKVFPTSNKQAALFSICNFLFFMTFFSYPVY